MMYIVFPVMIAMSVNQINILVDRTVAYSVSVGGVSSLNYANKLNDFVQGIYVISLATVMYPINSKMVAEKNILRLENSVSEAIASIIMGIIT